MCSQHRTGIEKPCHRSKITAFTYTHLHATALTQATRDSRNPCFLDMPRSSTSKSISSANSFPMHVVSSAPSGMHEEGESALGPVSPQTALLYGSKDQRGHYLALPTGTEFLSQTTTKMLTQNHTRLQQQQQKQPVRLSSSLCPVLCRVAIKRVMV